MPSLVVCLTYLPQNTIYGWKINVDYLLENPPVNCDKTSKTIIPIPIRLTIKDITDNNPENLFPFTFKILYILKEIKKELIIVTISPINKRTMDMFVKV